jgi:hypothetical protein
MYTDVLDTTATWAMNLAVSPQVYQDWLLTHAPSIFRAARVRTAAAVEFALSVTGNLTVVDALVLQAHPEILPMLRMAASPTLTREALAQHAQVPQALIEQMEDTDSLALEARQMSAQDLQRVADVIKQFLDRGVFAWLDEQRQPTAQEWMQATFLVADRLCCACAESQLHEEFLRHQGLCSSC